ncbi:Na+ dependent nucleoside transporter N-terminal domain-containing protein [Francisella sp. XLW-1]|uniref:Na+ dependent nucleoside transporter N-terminal domain-containing protein n=1 Tax=Francisella sp. XLW-1 TaxID=2610887 RepID=UPI00123DAF16
MLTKLIYFILSLIIIFLLSYTISFDRKSIKYKQCFRVLIAQLLLAYVLLQSNIGIKITDLPRQFGTVYLFIVTGHDY